MASLVLSGAWRPCLFDLGSLRAFSVRRAGPDGFEQGDQARLRRSASEGSVVRVMDGRPASRGGGAPRGGVHRPAGDLRTADARDDFFSRAGREARDAGRTRYPRGDLERREPSGRTPEDAKDVVLLEVIRAAPRPTRRPGGRHRPSGGGSSLLTPDWNGRSASARRQPRKHAHEGNLQSIVDMSVLSSGRPGRLELPPQAVGTAGREARSGRRGRAGSGRAAGLPFGNDSVRSSSTSLRMRVRLEKPVGEPASYSRAGEESRRL